MSVAFTVSSSAATPAQARLFLSRHCPPETRQWRIHQEYILRRFGLPAAAALSGTILLLKSRSDLLWASFVALGIAYVLAWVMAQYDLGNRLAAVEVSGNAFRVYSVGDWLRRDTKPQEPFPFSYAQPVRTASGLQITYHDGLVELKRADWPEFAALARQFTRPPA